MSMDYWMSTKGQSKMMNPQIKQLNRDQIINNLCLLPEKCGYKKQNLLALIQEQKWSTHCGKILGPCMYCGGENKGTKKANVGMR